MRGTVTATTFHFSTSVRGRVGSAYDCESNVVPAPDCTGGANLTVTTVFTINWEQHPRNSLVSNNYCNLPAIRTMYYTRTYYLQWQCISLCKFLFIADTLLIFHWQQQQLQVSTHTLQAYFQQHCQLMDLPFWMHLVFLKEQKELYVWVGHSTLSMHRTQYFSVSSMLLILKLPPVLTMNTSFSSPVQQH